MHILSEPDVFGQIILKHVLSLQTRSRILIRKQELSGAKTDLLKPCHYVSCPSAVRHIEDTDKMKEKQWCWCQRNLSLEVHICRGWRKAALKGPKGWAFFMIRHCLQYFPTGLQ